ncbi:MAG TPA: aminotransferase class V-fold PLP-dependent enzyme [Kofleriaceae bacterium]|nr:aminotransferase class V-fold PLP-dependent enzyme [Kofleriaceae bacterium]
MLDPAVVHLNHGAFGGCPVVVMAAAAAIRARVEAAPMRFFVLDWQRELDAARGELARFVGAPADALVFVPNATTGVAVALTAAASGIGAGDEIVATDHAYRACKNQLARLAVARGARVVVVPIALPFDPDACVDAIARAITPRTKLAVLDHVTSPTALIMPIERIVPVLAARGIAVAIDGAHAPGQLALDIRALLELGVTWYAGNNHKWLCAPKSTGFVVTTTPVVPIVTSHGASPEYGPDNRLHAELDWSGTTDPSAHLAVPAAIATVGHAEVRTRNHALAVAMRQVLLDAGAGVLAPESSLGSMAAVPIELPPNTAPLALQELLLRDGWEVPIVPWPAPIGPLLRVSAHLYNTIDQVDRLIGKLRSLGAGLRRA